MILPGPKHRLGLLRIICPHFRMVRKSIYIYYNIIYIYMIWTSGQFHALVRSPGTPFQFATLSQSTCAWPKASCLKHVANLAASHSTNQRGRWALVLATKGVCCAVFSCKTFGHTSADHLPYINGIKWVYTTQWPAEDILSAGYPRVAN